ncbi:hypothetical protein [Mycobacterium aquaticum]|uniref:Uncharacterized protein n=1 Tax=Mycobacterium aquaticum TaxID=1927124 RepID=A0A1X0ABK9_9MYCO|nr:hypothetical protein [Mycobacterium aquaticum]ORA27392.1 hypothetical protein BST13_30510 [Mycobacterium aquaticum]
MTDKISVKDKATVTSGAKDFRTQKEAVTSIGTDLQAEFDALITALGITVDGESAEGGVPTGLGASAKARADSAAASLGTLADSWETWVNRLEVIDGEGATAVEGAGGSTPKPADPKPSTPAPTPAPAKPANPLTPDLSVPPAFRMK